MYCVTHFTQFSYVVGFSKDNYHPERLYNSPIIYILIFFDLYLLCTLIMGVLYRSEMKSKKLDEIQPIDRTQGHIIPNDDSQSKLHGKTDGKLDDPEHFIIGGTGLEQQTMNRLETPKSGTGYAELPLPHRKQKNVSCPMICLMGIPFKWRMITPFTTSHDYLGRFGRGIVNISVLYLIWAFSGLIIDMGDYIAKPGYYFISFVICFIIARLFTFIMDVLMSKTRFLPLRIAKYVVGLAIIIVLHAPILFFTVHMQDEFFHWGMTSIILLFLELVVWESVSMLSQLVYLLVLKKQKDSSSLLHKILKFMVTPPLYRRVIG